MGTAFYRPPVQKGPRDTTRSRAVRAALSLGTALAVLAGLAGGAAALLRVHPRFAVVRVVLDGIPEAHRQDVEKLTDAWIGKPLLFADLDAPMRELGKRTWVVRASARRVVPDTIEVNVVSNPPVALARCEQGLCTVDAEGNLLGPWAGRAVSRKDDFVLIDILEDAAGTAELRTAALARGAALGERLRVEDPALLSRASEVVVLAGGFALVDRTARVRLLLPMDAAAPGRTAPVWRVFLALLPELQRQGLEPEEADLRFADQIVLKKPADDVRGQT
jgi:hypothetical protein